MLSKLVGKKLTDIYSIGYIDLENGEGVYHPDFRWIYFEFEDTLIEFESFKQFSKLRAEEVKDIRYQLEMDEDMIKAKSSIAEVVLISSFLAGNTVKQIEFKNGTEKECQAAQIILETGQIIFLDPSFPYGIGIGGKEQQEYWNFANI